MKKALLMAALAAAVVGLGLIKTIPVKHFMLFSIIGLLLVTCNSNIEFTRYLEKKICVRDSNCSYYVEYVLIKNVPKNKLEQSKVMIAYFDSVGFSVDDLITKMPDVNTYHMSFFKSKNKYHLVENNETDLGCMSIKRCDDDTTRWQVAILINLGTAWDYEYNGPDLTTVVLSNPCEPIHPYWATENRELENYYNELRDKRNNKD